MTYIKFNRLLSSVTALSPDEMRLLRDKLDHKIAEADARYDAAAKPPAPARKPIWERVLERSAAIPDEEYDKLPTDLSEQHDHYLYGTPKRPAQ
jgi:hypothetical protein